MKNTNYINMLCVSGGAAARCGGRDVTLLQHGKEIQDDYLPSGEVSRDISIACYIIFRIFYLFCPSENRLKTGDLGREKSIRATYL
jgi:hypothetical protein